MDETGLDKDVSDAEDVKPGKKPWENEIINVLESIETDYSQFRENIHSLRKNLQGFMEETEIKLREVRKEAESKVAPEAMKEGVGRAQKDIQDVGKKLHDVMGEIGFGESLDVSKIPPNILEGVYESTLEDVVSTMRRNLGSHDTDEKVKDALEMMRSRTSGSELFQYDGKKINVRNLVPSIEQKLISAKQVHATYTELLSKLVEHIPSYQPKNFRAMMKSKSLEFAIDKVTTLIHKTNKLETTVSNATNIVSSFSSQFNSRFMELREEMESIEGKVMEKIEERMSEFHEKIDGMESSLKFLEDLQEKLTVLDDFVDYRDELDRKIVELSTTLDMEMGRLENYIPQLKDEKESQEEEEAEDISDEEQYVFHAIPEDGITATSLANEIGEMVPDIQEKLTTLVEKGIIVESKRGRWTIYQRKDSVETEEPDEDTSEEGISETMETNHRLVYDSIPEDGCTLASLNREIEELDKDEIQDILNELIDHDRITTIKRNRWTIYLKAANTMEVE